MNKITMLRTMQVIEEGLNLLYDLNTESSNKFISTFDVTKLSFQSTEKLNLLLGDMKHHIESSFLEKSEIFENLINEGRHLASDIDIDVSLISFRMKPVMQLKMIQDSFISYFSNHGYNHKYYSGIFSDMAIVISEFIQKFSGGGFSSNTLKKAIKTGVTYLKKLGLVQASEDYLEILNSVKDDDIRDDRKILMNALDDMLLRFKNMLSKY